MEQAAGSVKAEAIEVSEQVKKLSITGYLTWIGFAIAMVKGDMKDPYFRFHINQSLIIHLMGMAGFALPFGLRPVLSIFSLVLWIIAFAGALRGEMKKAPLVGGVELLS